MAPNQAPQLTIATPRPVAALLGIDPVQPLPWVAHSSLVSVAAVDLRCVEGVISSAAPDRSSDSRMLAELDLPAGPPVPG
jgi:hypothetical protein